MIAQAAFISNSLRSQTRIGFSRRPYASLIEDTVTAPINLTIRDQMKSDRRSETCRVITIKIN